MPVDVLTLCLLIATAALAGWVDAIVGGGGLIQLPSLLIALPDAPVPAVSGTNKLSSVAGTAMATATYLRSVKVTWKLAVFLMAAAWVGSSIGASLVARVPRAVFTPLVLVIVIVVGIMTVKKPQMGLHEDHHHDLAGQRLRLIVIGLAVGLYDGLIGPGTGTFFVIAMVGLLGYTFLQASVLTKLANLTTNIAAITVLGIGGHIIWQLGLVMAAANLTGGLIGARMAVKRGNGFVRTIFLCVISLLAVRLGWDVVQSVV